MDQNSKPMQFLLACTQPDLVNSFLKRGQRDGKPSSEVAVDNVKKNIWC